MLKRVFFAFGLFLIITVPRISSSEPSRIEHHEKLEFLVGEWSTLHEIPSREGDGAMTVEGEAKVEWVLGASWLRHVFHADFPQRGEVFMMNMMNYSPSKKKYNFYMFDHFGGEAGIFYGDWIDEKTIVFTAKFEEEDGSSSYQKFTLSQVSDSELRFNRAFSDDGEHYHFELIGTYTRKGRGGGSDG